MSEIHIGQAVGKIGPAKKDPLDTAEHARPVIIISLPSYRGTEVRGVLVSLSTLYT